VCSLSNPVQNELSISFENETGEMNLQIIDAIGKIIHEEKIISTSEKTISFDYPAGVYYIRLSGERGIITDKIIKM
jgi:hypothetical protein